MAALAAAPAAGSGGSVLQFPTLESMTAKVREAEEYITRKEGLKSEEATKALEELFVQAVQVLHAQFNSQFLLKNTALSVVVGLDRLVGCEEIQGEVELHRTLSKVYRICVELTWHQKWKQLNGTVWPETRDKVIAHSARMVPGASATSLEQAFEYRCAQQAAKCLVPTEDEWVPFAKALMQAGGGAAAQSPSDVMEGFKGLMMWHAKNLVEDWYLATWEVRWVIAQVNTLAAFRTETIKKIVSAYIAVGLDKGSTYAQGVAILCMDVIRNPEAEEGLKDLMVHGDPHSKLPGMISMIQLERPGTFRDFLEHPKEVWKAIAKEADRFWKARSLATQFLRDFASNPKFQRYQEASIAALRARANELMERKGKHCAREIQESRQVIQSLGEQLNGLRVKVAEVADTYMDLGIRQHGPQFAQQGLEPERDGPQILRSPKEGIRSHHPHKYPELQEVQEQLRDLENERDKVKRTMDTKNQELEEVVSASEVLEGVDEEELSLLGQILR